VQPTNDETPSLFPELSDELQPTARAKPTSVAPQVPDASVTELSARIPSDLRLGTSSWSFPGWSSIVYDGAPSETLLAREGLAAYAKHPLFRSVGVDRTYYRPAPRAEFERLAAQVPSDFRFLVKMWRGVVEHGVRGPGTAAVSVANTFLDARVAEFECVRPAIEGLGDKCGPLLFQFAPMRLAGSRAHRGFLAQLAQFLAALPKGPLYAVEVRNRSLVSEEFAPRLGALLADNGAVPCLTVHPTMPDVETQSRALALDPSRPLVMRWMLRGNHAYAEAKDLYEPFDKIVEPDDASRDALARLARAALGAGVGVWVIVNNKAEGSSPLSVERLARKIVE